MGRVSQDVRCTHPAPLQTGAALLQSNPTEFDGGFDRGMSHGDR